MRFCVVCSSCGVVQLGVLISLSLFLCNHSLVVGPMPHCSIALVTWCLVVVRLVSSFPGLCWGARGRAFYRVRGVDVWGGTLVGFSVLTVLAGPGATCHRSFGCHTLVTVMPLAAVGGGTVQLGACLPVGSFLIILYLVFGIALDRARFCLVGGF